MPILPSRDLDETVGFYAALGFENRGAPAEEWGYVILGRGGLEIHFYQADDIDPLTTDACCYAFVDDARTLCEQWSRIVVPDMATGSRVVPVTDTDYGMSEFAVVDLSGNLIRIGSPH